MISQNTQNTKAVQAITATVQNHFPAVEKPRLIHKSGNPKAAVTKNSTSRTTHHVSTACRHAGVPSLAWLRVASMAQQCSTTPTRSASEGNRRASRLKAGPFHQNSC